MDQPGLPNELPPELREWFSVEIDLGDAPELHLVGLEAAEFVRCFDTLRRYAGIWSSRTFHIDAENADVTIGERPDVAELVVRREVSVACVGTDNFEVDGVRLPLIDMFLYPHEIQFFWWPSDEWQPEQIGAFFRLLTELLDLAPAAELSVDPRYPEPSRRRLGRAVGRSIGKPSRIRLH
jgi:hypothetical protein